MAKLIFAAAITLLLSALLVDAVKVTEIPCVAGSSTCSDADTNADCVSSFCACSENYELANEDTECKKSAGQTCSANADCASNDCDGSTGTDLCSGAPVAVTASIVLMFFTFLTSRFF